MDKQHERQGRKIEGVPAAGPKRPSMNTQDQRPSAARPDTALLYSVDDIAAMARVSRVFVVRLCLAGEMPRWLDIDGRRYWDRGSMLAAVRIARDTAHRQSAA